MYCDLHTHSNYSDGEYTPAKIIAEAKEKGLAVALTDHNTTAGLDEFLDAAKAAGVTAVPGIELSTDYNGKELHLLGLFIDRCYYDTVEMLTKKFAALKEISNMEMVERLNEDGINIDYLSVKKRTKNGNANRVHVAEELMEKGYAVSIEDALRKYLDKGKGYYRPSEKLGTLDAIKFLSGISALPILAHPLKELSPDELRKLLPEAIENGLCGIETIHSDYTSEMLIAARKIAEDFCLLQSGGSDFHGNKKPKISLGTGKGNISVPMEFYEKLFKKYLSQKRPFNTV